MLLLCHVKWHLTWCFLAAWVQCLCEPEKLSAAKAFAVSHDPCLEVAAGLWMCALVRCAIGLEGVDLLNYKYPRFWFWQLSCGELGPKSIFQWRVVEEQYILSNLCELSRISKVILASVIVFSWLVMCSTVSNSLLSSLSSKPVEGDRGLQRISSNMELGCAYMAQVLLRFCFWCRYSSEVAQCCSEAKASFFSERQPALISTSHLMLFILGWRWLLCCLHGPKWSDILSTKVVNNSTCSVYFLTSHPSSPPYTSFPIYCRLSPWPISRLSPECPVWSKVSNVQTIKWALQFIFQTLIVLSPVYTCRKTFVYNCKHLHQEKKRAELSWSTQKSKRYGCLRIAHTVKNVCDYAQHSGGLRMALCKSLSSVG